MSQATGPIPAGHEGLIPHLVCDPCTGAIEFYKRAFGAKEAMRMPAQDGKRLMHAELVINGGSVMLSDEFPEYGPDRAPSKDRPAGLQ